MKKNCLMGVLILSVVILSGCTSLNSQFDCPNQAGVRCKSLDKINDMVNSGELPKRAESGCDSALSTNYFSHSWGRWRRSGCNSTIVQTSLQFETYLEATTISMDEPYRSPEKVSLVWIAAYEDSEGNYHQDTMIYTVSAKSHWETPKIIPINVLDERNLWKGAGYAG